MPSKMVGTELGYHRDPRVGVPLLRKDADLCRGSQFQRNGDMGERFPISGHNQSFQRNHSMAH